MANPQKENGYTAIANEIAEALAGIRIPGEANQLLWVILRKTYGWNKKEDHIALSQFSLLAKMPKSEVCRGLRKLRKMNLVIGKKANTTGNLYRFNKDFGTWKPLAKKPPIGKKANESLAKKPHTKDTIQKKEEKSVFSLNENKDTAAKFLEHYMVKFHEYVSKKKNPIYPKEQIIPKIDVALNEYGEDRLKELLEIYMQKKDRFYEDNLWSLTCFLSYKILNKLNVGNK